MSILGAALAGGAQGAQNHFDNRTQELREEAERAFQMRLLDRADAREDLRHERAVEQDYINYQRDTLNNDIQISREDSRYKDSRADADRAFKQQDRQLDIMDRRVTESAQGNDSQTIKLYQDYNKEVADIRKMRAEGTIDETLERNMLIDAELRYGKIIPGFSNTPGAAQNDDDTAANPLAEQEAAANAEQAALAEQKAKEKAEREELAAGAKQDLSDSGFELQPSVGEKFGGLLSRAKEAVSPLIGKSSDRFAKREYEQLIGARKDRTLQIQHAWGVVNYGMNIYPPGSQERELALRVLRASNASGVPTE